MNEIDPTLFPSRVGAIVGAIALWGSATTLTVAQQPPPADAQQLPPPATDPRDRLLQPAPTPTPLPPTEERLAPEVPPVPEAGDDAATIFVRRVSITGSTVFAAADFAPIVTPLQGRSVTLPELFEAANEVTRLYLADGYLTSRAVLIEESLVSGEIELRVIEGSVESIEIDGLKRIRDRYVRSRIERAAKAPLRVNTLEDQLRLLQLDPLFELIEASLKSGSSVGKSVVSVRVTEARPWDARISSDNYSPPSIGGERFQGQASYNNLTGRGDRVSLEVGVTTLGGSDTIDASYRLPLNSRDGSLQLRALVNNNEVVTEELQDLNITGDFELYEISYRQPLKRSPREELAFGIGFTHQRGRTRVDGVPTPLTIGADDDARSITSTLRLSQEYIRRGATGAWALRSQFNIGTGIFNATDNADDIPDSMFFSWLGQVQRVQVLGENNFLILLADFQLAPNPLLPAEQFAIGGGQSVRGYRQNILGGDNGVRLSVEDRITLVRNDAGEAKLQLAPFIDFGAVFNAAGNPNDLAQDNTVLVGLGAGILWEPIESLSIRLDYGVPLVDVDESDNVQDDGFFFNVVFTP
ncbi:MAG: ShlB/FhaC/HecB family hemolysin secretion/activation protein [Cyanobacteria bacterium J06641_5]